jgi:5-deoxy-glucuronate isomerase
MHSSSGSFLIVPNFTHDEYIHITPLSAQRDDLSFAARRMGRGGMWDFETHENEFALVVMGGTCQIRSNKGAWTDVCRRLNVFAGMSYTLYIPPETRFTVEARSQHLDIAYGWCIAKEAYPPRFVKPAEIEIRGGGNATRQINKMIPPGFPLSMDME